MDTYQSLDICIFCVVCLLLMISVVGYWFGLKTQDEHFDKCPSLKCDVALVNNRIKNAYIMIQYLEDCTKEITSTISLNNLQEQIEPYEDIYISLTGIEDKIRQISNQQSTILKVWNYIKNTKISFKSNKKQNIDCFQIKSPEECNSEALKNVLKQLSSKIEEISYQTGLYYYYMVEIQKMTAEYNAQREKAVKASSAQASSLMSNVLGKPINIDLSKNFNNPTDPAIMKAAKSGNVADLAKMALNNPDMIKYTSNINSKNSSDNAAKMYDKTGPNAGQSFGNTGNNLISSGLDKSKDPEKAQTKYKDGQKKKNIPAGFL